MDRPPPDRTVVVGATGLVGRHLVRILTAAGSHVTAAGRREPAEGEARFHRLDLEALVAEPDEAGDLFEGTGAVFVALGTTRRAAGSREAFRRVDLEYVAAVGRSARRAGVPHLLAVSSVGASLRASNFYLQVKGEAEEALRGLGFPSLTLARPSLLLGERAPPRPAEAIGGVVLRILRPLLAGPFERYRPIGADMVARALVRAAADPAPGPTVLESPHLVRLGG